jgi:Uma2 family endonuclease
MQPPALIIEILSPSTTKRDRHRKRPAYLAHGVREVWLIDLDARPVEQWTAASEFPQRYTTNMTWSPIEQVPALTIDLALLFTGLS